MRSVMETVFGRGNSAIIEMELEAARRRIEEYDYDWADDRDEWPGTFGSDEGAHEVFRFVFRAQELVPPGKELMGEWEQHHQVSVTFSTVTRRWGFQRAFIDDGGDRIGDEQEIWVLRASILRNQQFVRVNYDSYDYMVGTPVITTGDIDNGGGEQVKTRRTMGKRDDLYPLNHANKAWSKRCDRNIHLKLHHDGDFMVLWDAYQSDCVVYDFRESEEKKQK